MRKLTTILLLLSIAIQSLYAAQLPRIHIIATGGTIAGVAKSATDNSYNPSVLGVESLTASVPEIMTLAQITSEQFCTVSSQDMTPDIWVALAARVNELLAGDKIDGIVITHGTDTMEETAYFLNLTVGSAKPVVMVGSMRPSTALSADGPSNLYNAVAVAASKKSAGRGVLLAMNNKIIDAHSLVKSHSTDIETFESKDGGSIGAVANNAVTFEKISRRLNTTNSIFDTKTTMPKVGIVVSYAGAGTEAFDALVAAGYKGIIIEGVGNGNMNKELMERAIAAQKNGVQIVRATRIPHGGVTIDGEVDDAKYSFVASDVHSAQKARILLMLALGKTTDRDKLQEYFLNY